MDKIVFLKKVPLFEGLRDADLRKVLTIGKLQRLTAGQTIFKEHTMGDKLYLVMSGRVKIFAVSGEKKKTLAYLERGEFFGEMALLDQEPRSASSLAQEDCELLVINRKDFRALLARHPGISLEVMKQLSLRLRQADREIEALTFENVLGRVAKALLVLADKYGEKAEKGVRITMPLNQSEIAEIAGTGREMVSRIINRFRRLKCIESEGQYLVITNPEKLKTWIY